MILIETKKLVNRKNLISTCVLTISSNHQMHITVFLEYYILPYLSGEFLVTNEVLYSGREYCFTLYGLCTVVSKRLPNASALLYYIDVISIQIVIDYIPQTWRQA